MKNVYFIEKHAYITHNAIWLQMDGFIGCAQLVASGRDKEPAAEVW